MLQLSDNMFLYGVCHLKEVIGYGKVNGRHGGSEKVCD